MSTVKTAVVTGASQGIGAAIVQKLLSQNYQVYGISRSVKSLSDKNFFPIRFDLTDFSHYSRLTDQLPQAIDVLVNDAGLGFEKLADRITLTDIDTTFHLNFYSPVLLTASLLPRLQTGAAVINITSVMAIISDPGYSLYCASKSALDRYTTTLAKEFPRLQVVSVMPAGTRTPMYPIGTILPEQIAEVVWTAVSKKFASGSLVAVVDHSSRGWWTERDTYDLVVDLGKNGRS